MKEDKNKKSEELGKNELGEISGGSHINPMLDIAITKEKFVRAYYGVPNNPSSWGKTAPEDMPLNPFQPQVKSSPEEDINKLNPLPDNNEQDSNK